jgi:hypothetical protein
MPNGAPAGYDGSSARVFVEVARWEGDPLTSLRPGEGGGLVLDAGRESVGIHHALANNDEVKTVAWDTAPSTANGSKSQVHWDMKLTPRVVASSPPGVRIEVEIAGGKSAHTTLVLRDQQTSILDWLGDPGSSTPRTIVAVTPYVLRDDADVQRLLECKREAAETARRHSAPAPR